MKKFTYYFFYAVFMAFLFYCAVVYRKDISNGVSFGIDYCFNQLIPSLFPMIFLSCFVSFCPLNSLISRAFSFFTTKVLKVPSCLASVIIFGLCCGYPVGAKLCSNMLKQNKIDTKTAENCLMYCISPGIAFCVLFVGAGILGSVQIGFYMFVSITIASLFTAFLIGLGKKPVKSKEPKKEKFSFLDCFNLSAKSSLNSTVTMCLYVVIFSAFFPLLALIKLPAKLEVVVSFFLDVVHGTVLASEQHISVYVLVFGLCFAGLCIHFQVLSLFNINKISLLKFYIGRILTSILSLINLKIIFHFFPIAVSTLSPLTNYQVQTSKASATGSLCLVLLSLSFIYCNVLVEKTEKI